MERQQNAPIQVIVGNPPWSAGQRSSADDNPNVDYPDLEKRIADTYAARSKATLKRGLYDTYKLAIRWASDRIEEHGVIALVTNGSWIDGNVDSGVRACLAEEFSSVWVLNLRGNQRTSGERSRREGGKVFGQGSRAPVAVTLLVRNPDVDHEGCRILYRDVGDYLSREEKLGVLKDAGSLASIADWREIEPDQHHDWIGQRDPAFRKLFPVGSKAVKAGKPGEAVFRLFSNGYKTGRDPWVYNYSPENCADAARRMVEDYLGALKTLEESPGTEVREVTEAHSAHSHWDEKTVGRVSGLFTAEFSDQHLRPVVYRPFVKTWLYADRMFAQRPAKTGEMFPDDGEENNRVICATGIGSTKPFSALIVDTMPDLELISKGQCFPRYRFERRREAQWDLLAADGVLERIDNITGMALRAFRVRYGDSAITKDAIFDYVYGVLHSPIWRERFPNDLTKELPRVPFAADFHAFAEAGAFLAELHLGYENCREYLLELRFAGEGVPQPEHFRLGTKAMKLEDGGAVLRVNERVRLTGIPAEAHQYEVNGRTPLGWFIDRYKVVRDKRSGIVNDPNGWFEEPRDLIGAICRIVHVSVETVRIVEGLPTIDALKGTHK